MATATLNTAKQFAVGTVGDDASHWTLWDAATAGNLLWSDTVVGDPAPLTANQYFNVPANNLVITVPVGTDGATAEMARRAAAGAVTGTTYLQLHSNAPGTSGNNNVLTSTRVAVAFADWTVAA